MNVGIMKFEGNFLQDHTVDPTRKPANETIAHAGATGIEMTIIIPANAWRPAPTYPNRTLYASRLCSDRAIRQAYGSTVTEASETTPSSKRKARTSGLGPTTGPTIT